MLKFLLFLRLYIDKFKPEMMNLSHADAGHKCVGSHCGNYKVVLSCGIIFQAMNLHRHSAYVKEGGYMHFL